MHKNCQIERFAREIQSTMFSFWALNYVAKYLYDRSILKFDPLEILVITSKIVFHIDRLYPMSHRLCVTPRCVTFFVKFVFCLVHSTVHRKMDEKTFFSSKKFISICSGQCILCATMSPMCNTFVESLGDARWVQPVYLHYN